MLTLRASPSIQAWSSISAGEHILSCCHARVHFLMQAALSDLLIAGNSAHSSCVLLGHLCRWRASPFDYVCVLGSAPVCAMVWEGKSVVATGRKIIGATNPLASEPGTIRGDFCIDVGRNIIHGSDAVESAKREIQLWFPEGLVEYKPYIFPWVYE